MENTEILQQKLSSIDRGAQWCRILGIVLLVFGILALVAAGVTFGTNVGLRGATVSEGLGLSFSIVGESITQFIMAWLAYRASDAFASIAALIREMGEIV